MKKVLLIVIDACSSRVLAPALDNGKLPNIQALVEAGSFNPTCTSIFPSITHAATASIATGLYPQGHGIAGSHWYNIDSDDPVYYSGDFWMIMNRGLDQFFEDFAVRLNHQWLQAETIFQSVERAGLKTACLNHVIFRGDVKHTLDVPHLLSLLPGIPTTEQVYGPSLFCMGDFITAIPQATFEASNATGGVLHRFGFEDNYTADLLIQLAKDGILPDFTLAYFPDNDDQSHEVGPEMAVTTLEHFDNRLGELIAAYGDLESMLQELCLILTGDHAQSDILADVEKANIRLDEVLANFSLAVPGQPWMLEDELMVCPNLRMAQIYFRHPSRQQLEQVVAQLLNESRIDQIIWPARLTNGKLPGYEVVTADRGMLYFRPGDDGPQTAVDQQGNVWSWRNDLSAVGGQVTADNILSFPDYPNAFERIRGGLECDSGGHLWVTAKPGYEFGFSDNMSIHAGGGSHGSLHILDSIVPLLIAGAPSDINLLQHPRIVDVVPLCLSILGLD